MGRVNVYSTMTLAKEWGCARSTVYGAVMDGRLPAFRIGKREAHVRITPEAAAAYLEEFGHPRDVDPDRLSLSETIAMWGEPYSNNVYFAGTDGFVKIGYARRSNLLLRLHGIQCMNPKPLILLCVVEGTISTEREFHRRFRALHARGEWFRHEGALAEFIESIPCKGVPGVTHEPGFDDEA